MLEHKEKNFVSAVVYVENLDCFSFLKGLDGLLSRHFEHYELICVNDSEDKSVGTGLKKFGKEEGISFQLLTMSFSHGLEKAMHAGVDLAIGDFVFEFDDASLVFPWDLVFQVYEKSLEGFDIVHAVPKGRKNLLSKAFYGLYNHEKKGSYQLQTQSFRILSRRGINRVQSIHKTIPYRKAIYANCGLDLFFMEYPWEAQGKHPKSSRSAQFELALNSFMLFTDVFYKVSLSAALFFLASTFFVAGYTLFIFLNAQPIEGWSTTMLFLSFAFSGVFSLMAVIIKYLSLLMNLIFQEQEYLTRSLERI